MLEEEGTNRSSIVVEFQVVLLENCEIITSLLRLLDMHIDIHKAVSCMHRSDYTDMIMIIHIYIYNII